MKKKILAILLVMTVLLGLFAGCGKSETPDGSSPAGAASDNKEVAGMLLLNVGGAVEIMYNSDGAALRVDGYGENGTAIAGAVDYEGAIIGASCVEAVGIVAQKAMDAGYINDDTKTVLIKQVIDSALPEEDFLNKCVAEMEKRVPDANVFLATEKELDNNGYLALGAAENLLKLHLSMSGDVTFDGPLTPLAGKYYLSTQYQETVVYYVVDATDGSIVSCTAEDYKTIIEQGVPSVEIEQGNMMEEAVDPENTFIIDATEDTTTAAQ